jgi:preprotein translocase subunit SecA
MASVMMMAAPRPRGVVRPGTVFGAYPERMVDTAGRRGARAWSSDSARFGGIAAQAARVAAQWRALPVERWSERRRAIGAEIGARGFESAALAAALGCVGAHAERTLGLSFFPTQYFCAAALLGQRLAEMATGEGKTLAAGMAAAVGALAGMPVHLITANDYLAERDATLLEPLYRALGASVAHVTERDELAARQQAYRADVVYATAKVIAFDYLRDRLRRGTGRGDLDVRLLRDEQGLAPLMLRGLCMAIVDEADSVLIDEAKMPLIISEERADESERARIWQSLDIAGRLAPEQHFVLAPAEKRATLTPSGRTEIARMAEEYGPLWLNRRHREELIERALGAMHLFRRDIDYLVEDGEVRIIDAVTGRSAPGRVWSRGLHAAIALKEGVQPPAASDTRARITYPRLFARYHHLAGLSGTLREVRGELRRSYGMSVVEVPLNRPSRRRSLPTRVFATRIDLFRATLERARSVVASGRPVLLATDSVTDSQWFAARFAQLGTPFALLNARTATEEAEVVALAGQSARVTVATQMAGRGTDIKLAQPILERGGLHVLSIQHSRSRRLDRQIAGRAGRQGEPGSCEHWTCLESPLIEHAPLGGALARMLRKSRARQAFGRAFVSYAQRSAEAEDAATRRMTARQDKEWSRQLHFASVHE